MFRSSVFDRCLGKSVFQSLYNEEGSLPATHKLVDFSLIFFRWQGHIRINNIIHLKVNQVLQLLYKGCYCWYFLWFISSYSCFDALVRFKFPKHGLIIADFSSSFLLWYFGKHFDYINEFYKHFYFYFFRIFLHKKRDNIRTPTNSTWNQIQHFGKWFVSDWK